MIEFEKCFIMWCNSFTEKTCLDRSLFGSGQSSFPYLKEIKTGDIGFLLNYYSDELIGIFRAISEPQLNIEPDAWDGKYPAQVRVELINKKIQRISGAVAMLKKIGIKMKYGKSFIAPQFPVHDREVGEKILAHFGTTVLVGGSTTRVKLPSDARPQYGKGFDEVVGLNDVKKFIKRRMVDPVTDFEKAQKYYLRLGGGLLLYGPKGTGKTLIAQATATEIDAQFEELSPSIIRGYPGDAEKKIEEIFQKLLKLPRSVVFLDEAEALLGTRAGQTGSVMPRISAVLLAQFTKLQQERYHFKPILIIAATNKPRSIDDAFLRPGRLDRCLYVGLPDEKARIELLRLSLQRRNKDAVDDELYDDEQLLNLAKKLDGYSSADIGEIVDDAAHEAFARGNQITCPIIEESIKTVPKSVDPRQLEDYKRWGREHGNRL